MSGTTLTSSKWKRLALLCLLSMILVLMKKRWNWARDSEIQKNKQVILKENVKLSFHVVLKSKIVRIHGVVARTKINKNLLENPYFPDLFLPLKNQIGLSKKIQSSWIKITKVLIILLSSINLIAKKIKRWISEDFRAHLKEIISSQRLIYCFVRISTKIICVRKFQWAKA
jgi:hypothetical protein